MCTVVVSRCLSSVLKKKYIHVFIIVSLKHQQNEHAIAKAITARSLLAIPLNTYNSKINDIVSAQCVGKIRLLICCNSKWLNVKLQLGFGIGLLLSE